VIELTNKEYALLAVLMHRPGRIVTRRQIEEQLWDLDADTESNVINVYIAQLRRKIDADRARPLIRTVRGVGYTMRANP
jgi:two-component system copper resistance phosphate regulon response regulator CusR